MVWANQVAGLNLSVVTVEEIHYGLSGRPDDRIGSWFEKFLSEQCRVAFFPSRTTSPAELATCAAASAPRAGRGLKQTC